MEDDWMNRCEYECQICEDENSYLGNDYDDFVRHIKANHTSVWRYLIITQSLGMSRPVMYPCSVCSRSVPWDFRHMGEHQRRYHPQEFDLSINRDSEIYG